MEEERCFSRALCSSSFLLWRSIQEGSCQYKRVRKKVCSKKLHTGITNHNKKEILKRCRPAAGGDANSLHYMWAEKMIRMMR